MPDDNTVAEVTPKEYPDALGETTCPQTSRAIELDNARPLNMHRWSDHKEADDTVELVIEQIRAQRLMRRVLEKHKVHLKVVILDLYAAWVHDSTRYVSYSRSANDYCVDSRYNDLGIGYRPLVKVIDALIALHYLDTARGYIDRKKKKGRWSRMRPRQNFIDLIENAAGLRPEMLERAPDEEVIILRDAEKKDIDYEETPDTQIMRDRLRFINRALSCHAIHLNLPDAEMTDLARKLERDDDKTPIDFTRTRLRRIFNNDSFEEGGRFYGGWWQEIPREYREFITINGKRIVELDYGELHPRLLYAQEGIPCPIKRDPYDIPATGVDRDITKRIFNILLNALTEEKAIGAIRKEFRLPSKAIDHAITAIKEAHQPIAEYFHRGIGRKLQNQDATLAEKIMLYMIEQHYVVALPVHDSFIVRQSHEDELMEVMESYFQDLFTGTEAQAKLKTSYFAEGMGETSMSSFFETFSTDKELFARREWLQKRAEAMKKTYPGWWLMPPLRDSNL